VASFREFVIINGVAQMNKAPLRLEDDGNTFVIANIIGQTGEEDCVGCLEVRIQRDGDSRFFIEGDDTPDTRIPLEYNTGPRELFLNLESATGEGQGPEGDLSVITLPACCQACKFVHSLGLHRLDCICCDGYCRFRCP
jgi:hypothetical protein